MYVNGTQREKDRRKSKGEDDEGVQFACGLQTA